MPLLPSDIQSGKCYVANNKEKHSVIEITRGIVTYQSWTTDPKKLSLRINAGVKPFAEAMVKEIPCPSRN